MADTRFEFQTQFDALRAMLACPACEGELRLDGERIVCPNCARTYPIVDGIPVLIAEQVSNSGVDCLPSKEIG